MYSLCLRTVQPHLNNIAQHQVQGNVLSTYLKGDTRSVLIIRGTYYQGWFMYMRYTQGQNEEYLLPRSMC